MTGVIGRPCMTDPPPRGTLLEHPYMNKIPAMKNQISGYGLAAILLCSAALAPLANAAEEATIRNQNGISHVSGGIGEQSISQLGALTGNFNIKLVFALNSGNYVSDVGVNIMDATGKTLLETTSEGPWFLARLPKGKYQIAATLSGNTIKRQIVVGTAPLVTTHFRWATE